MRGKRALHERLHAAGIAYAALGIGISFYTIFHFIRLYRNGPIVLPADTALTYSLVFSTVLLLLAGASAIAGALLVRSVSRRLWSL